MICGLWFVVCGLWFVFCGLCECECECDLCVCALRLVLAVCVCVCVCVCVLFECVHAYANSCKMSSWVAWVGWTVIVCLVAHFLLNFAAACHLWRCASGAIGDRL